MKSTIITLGLGLILLVFTSTPGIAQRRILNGYLRDSTTLFPITYGNITNSTTNKSVRSDDKGFFRIEAQPNDFLFASAKLYRYDTLKVSYITTDTITIFLPLAGAVLPTVTVRGHYNRYQQDSIERRRDFDESMGNRGKTLSNSHPSGFGLTINLDKIISKKNGNRKTEERVFTTLEKNAYIDYRFSPNVVAYYTGFKGEKLRSFMKFCSPTYEWLRAHPNNEDVLYFINDKLKAYKASATKS